MNILLIGNGFDLAHGLKTRYTDFLEFVKTIQKQEEVDDQYLNECKSLIRENTWIMYFLDTYEERVKEGKENWIDFEKEISEKIQSLESLYKKICLYSKQHLGSSLDSDDWHALRILLKAISDDWKSISSINIEQVKEIKSILLIDLNRMTRCLEIYLSKVIEVNSIDKIGFFENHSIDKVLSFNYTNTFERLYKNGKKIEYDYIHGKAKLDGDVNQCNLVLGIDEYLPDAEKDENVEFIQFKKFYQRIYKRTGSSYKDWIKSICEFEENEKIKKAMQRCNMKNQLFIFGHSLDITDKDILKELILNEYISTIIYYHNQEALNQLITNLIKIIGQDNLIRYTGGNHAKICFKKFKGK